MTTTTMSAARVHAWGGPPVVDQVPRPVPGPGESLVKVEAAAVAHLDVTVAGGSFRIQPDRPYVGGVEGAGVVVESDSMAVGTRVVLRGGGLGLVRPGTWAEYVAVETAALIPAPEHLSPSLCATFWVPTTTAHTALHAVGRLGGWLRDRSARDEHVIVAGAAGAVGSIVVQMALRAGAQVTALVLDAEQQAALPDGVASVTAADTDGAAALVEARAGTLLIDTLGGRSLPERLLMVQPGGRAVLVGYVAGTDVSLDLSNWLLDDVAMLPVNMIRRTQEARALVPALAESLRSGELSLEVQEFALADAGHAFELLSTGKIRGRAVLLPHAE